MLNFEQIRAIEGAFGADKAGPIIQAFEAMESRSKDELATKADIELLKAELGLAKSDLQGSIKDLEVKLTVRMGAMLAVVLAVVAALKVL